MKRICAVLTMVLALIYGTASAAMFTYTGAQQTYVVPPGVHELMVWMAGAQGNGPVRASDSRTTGGAGGEITAYSLRVTPGETIYVYVGGYTGWPNGGTENAAYQGGGSSDIRRGGNATSNIIMIAGGGGGGWNLNSFGNGLGYGSYPPYYSSSMIGAPSLGYSGGGGATLTAGGTGATGLDSNGSPGAFFQGGAAGKGKNTGDLLGGNGGGGYYGGGGAGNYGKNAPAGSNPPGGGGGASWVIPALESDVLYGFWGAGYNTPKNGYVEIGIPWDFGQRAPLY